MSEWRDISTAPKDGSDILAWNGERIILVSWWSAYGWRDDNQGYNGITLWQPLPAPPTPTDPPTPAQQKPAE